MSEPTHCGDGIPFVESCTAPCPCCSYSCGLPGCDASLLPFGLLVAPMLRRPATRRDRLSAPSRAGAALIRGYQRTISARTPARCRFAPTCSNYAATAIARFGLWRGGLLTADRLRRCGLVRCGTADPVPAG